LAPLATEQRLGAALSGLMANHLCRGELITAKSASKMTKRVTFAGSLRESRRPLAISAFLCFADCIPWMLDPCTTGV
jgi:hypothetical protein